ncbi:MAG: hypothetical protein V1647_04205 [Pseudomonadota bacterium]
MNKRRITNRLLTTDAKRGQAMIETIFMIPFLIVSIFFMYQAYTLVNKVSVVQKYLKVEVTGRLLNRPTITAEDQTASVPEGKNPPTDGRYFYAYEDYDSGNKLTSYSLDSVTVNLLLTFDTKGDRGGLTSILKQGMAGRQMLGVCIGGNGIMGDQVDTKIFDKMSPGAICGNK